MVHGMELGLLGGGKEEDLRSWRKAEEEEAGMQGLESYSERSKREDQEALLCGTEHETGADNNPKPPVHPIQMRAFFVAAALAVFSSSLGILTTLSQTGGGYKYDYATIPLLAELLKFLVCGYLLWKELKLPQSAAVTTEWSSILLYPILSIIYLVHNNVLFLTLTYVDTSTYQIMGNLKIVTTRILFRRLRKELIVFVHLVLRMRAMAEAGGRGPPLMVPRNDLGIWACWVCLEEVTPGRCKGRRGGGGLGAGRATASQAASLV